MKDGLAGQTVELLTRGHRTLQHEGYCGATGHLYGQTTEGLQGTTNHCALLGHVEIVNGRELGAPHPETKLIFQSPRDDLKVIFGLILIQIHSLVLPRLQRTI